MEDIIVDEPARLLFAAVRKKGFAAAVQDAT